jgi:hypothetical protein
MRLAIFGIQCKKKKHEKGRPYTCVSFMHYQQDTYHTKQSYSMPVKENYSTCPFAGTITKIKLFLKQRSRNNQHYTQICTTALFHMLVPTPFGTSLPSSRSFWIRLSYMKIHAYGHSWEAQQTEPRYSKTQTT